jgi:hypothetical protein
MNSDAGHYFAEGRVGPSTLTDGAVAQLRSARSGALVTANAHARFQEAVARGTVFSLNLAATTTGIAAGNIMSAAAAASTNFALFNPANSGKLLVLVRFRVGIISGTAPAGPLFHGYIPNVPTVAGTGTILSNLLSGGAASVAKTFATAAGTTLTGGLAPVTHSLANFAATSTVQAAPYLIATEDLVDGALVVPQGAGWLPLWGAAGTSVLCGYSITWEEIPA